MPIDQLYQIIESAILRLGFPIFVAVWLLYERLVFTRKLIDTLERLTEAIEIQTIASNYTSGWRTTEAGEHAIRVQE